MNIGIDARLLERKMTGIGRFLITILKELPDTDKENKYFLFSYEKLSFNDAYFTNVATVKSFLPQKLFAPVWNNFILPGYLRKYKIDLFFSINQQVPLVKIKNVRYILVLHDVIYRVNKTFHPFIYRKYLQFFTYFSLKSSDLIITVSEYSKKDILKYYKVSEDKIRVVYEAADKEFKVLLLSDEEKQELRNQLKLNDTFVLYVGMIENRKNISGIMSIADEIYKINPEIKFVLIGKIGYGGDKLLKEMQLRNNVIYLSNINDQTLKKLYNIAAIFLFPSYYEGFGFPPLEAMQSGLPVLASNTTSLKEVIGKGGLLHDPDDYKSFANDIIKLLTDKDFFETVRKSGLERSELYGIKKTVKELVNIFNGFRKNH